MPKLISVNKLPKIFQGKWNTIVFYAFYATYRISGGTKSRKCVAKDIQEHYGIDEDDMPMHSIMKSIQDTRTKLIFEKDKILETYE